jgi:Ca2+/Na+ antiporter
MKMLWLVLAVIFAAVISIWMILRSGKGYSVQDTEAHATNYADEIKEGHGRMTLFLWISFITILIWTVIYFIQHAGEFAVIFGK